MKDLDDELWALGILPRPSTTRSPPASMSSHRSIEEVNEAIDQNLIMMEKMKLIASRHDLVCLLHEKPFAGVNGSGKHDNWSLGTADENLLEPGDTPLENLQFIVFLTAVIEAVDKYQDLLRASVASAGNDHRLGANEAPRRSCRSSWATSSPRSSRSIIDGKASVHATHGVLDLGADALPKLMQDNTDRNRTLRSPSRATSSSSVPAAPSRTSRSQHGLGRCRCQVAQGFRRCPEGTPEDKFQDAALEYCKKVLTDHQRILFSGDGYSDEWPIEAEKRGLPTTRQPRTLCPPLSPRRLLPCSTRWAFSPRPRPSVATTASSRSTTSS